MRPAGYLEVLMWPTEQFEFETPALDEQQFWEGFYCNWLTFFSQ